MKTYILTSGVKNRLQALGKTPVCQGIVDGNANIERIPHLREEWKSNC